jgi:hypothetical protein
LIKKYSRLNQVLKYITEFYRKEFNFFYFILTLSMLGVLIYFNYWHFLEKQYISSSDSRLQGFVGYYFLYFIPFAAAFFLQKFFYKNCNYFKNRWFWAILILGPAIFSFRVIFNYHQIFITNFWQGEEQQFWLKSINWIVRVMVVLILIFIIWRIKDKNKQPFYGIKKLDNANPYLWMLLIMIPLIALASTQKDFLHMYPKVKFLNTMEYWKRYMAVCCL